MKAITIHQPYASLIACGAKRFETRARRTHYRRQIAIHAGKTIFVPRDHSTGKAIVDALLFDVPRRTLLPYLDIVGFINWIRGKCERLPHGAMIATAELVECWHVDYIYPEYEGEGISRVKVRGYREAVRLVRPAINGRGQNGIVVRKDETLLGDYTVGRYAWELANVKQLPQPVPCRGQQGLWNWEPPSGTL